MRKRMRGIGTLIFLALLALLMVVSCEEAATDSGSDSDGSNSDGSESTVGDNLIGTWTGTWTDTYFEKTGSLEMVIAEGTSGLEGSGAIDVREAGISSNLTESATVTTTVAGDTISFDFTSSAIGSGSGTVVGNAIEGSGTTTAYGAFTFSGTISDTTITGTFDFTDGLGEGEISVTLQQ